ncbi:TonB-dependent receptor [Desulfobacterales bacterium HSG2]|nr:TonB-dependent receptor [Desulfobacterales bacterium HSG2]
MSDSATNASHPVRSGVCAAAFSVSLRLTAAIFFILITGISPCRASDMLPQEETGYIDQSDEDEISFYELEEQLMVTATGTTKTVRQAPSVASVITAEDIERTGAVTLQEAVEMVPGLHFIGVNQNGAMGMVADIYSMRGVMTNKNPHVLMMINSIPVTVHTIGARTINAFPVSNISRIEVIRGPGSAVYGADAFAGTINVITKSAEEIGGTRSGFRGGSFDTYGAWVQHGSGGTPGGWEVALGLEILETGGDSDRILDTDAQTRFDSLFGTTASRAPGSPDTGGRIITANTELARDNFTLRVMGYWNDSNFGAGGANTLGTKEWSQDVYLASMTYQNDELADDWNLVGNISYLYHDDDALMEIFPAGAVLPVGDDGNLLTPGGGMVSFPDGVWGQPGRTEETASTELTGLHSGFENHFFRISAGFRRADVTPKSLTNTGPAVLDGTEEVADGTMVSTTDTEYVYMERENIRDVWFLSLQDEWKFARKWELTAGVRYDHYSDFGHTVNPRLALVWNTSGELILKLLFGTAFRPPALAELYAKNNPSGLGNPDLDPETVRTLELVFDYRPVPRLHTTLNLFGYKIKDLIDLVKDPDTGIGRWQNVRDQDGYGFEAEAKLAVTDTLSLAGNFSYQHSEDADTDEAVPNAPGMQAYLNAHWMFLPDWSFDTSLHWVAKRERAESDTREDVDDYATVNMVLRRKNIFRHWDLAIIARNLFDEDIREPAPPAIENDYPMEGRSFFGEVRWHF